MMSPNSKSLERNLVEYIQWLMVKLAFDHTLRKKEAGAEFKTDEMIVKYVKSVLEKGVPESNYVDWFSEYFYDIRIVPDNVFCSKLLSFFPVQMVDIDQEEEANINDDEEDDEDEYAPLDMAKVRSPNGKRLEENLYVFFRLALCGVAFDPFVVRTRSSYHDFEDLYEEHRQSLDSAISCHINNILNTEEVRNFWERGHELVQTSQINFAQWLIKDAMGLPIHDTLLFDVMILSYFHLNDEFNYWEVDRTDDEEDTDDEVDYNSVNTPSFFIMLML